MLVLLSIYRLYNAISELFFPSSKDDDMSIGNGASAWPSVIVSNGRISRSEHKNIALSDFVPFTESNAQNIRKIRECFDKLAQDPNYYVKDRAAHVLGNIKMHIPDLDAYLTEWT